MKRLISADEARRLLGLESLADLAQATSSNILPSQLIVLWTGAKLMVYQSGAGPEYSLEGDDPDGSDVEKVIPFLLNGSQFHDGTPGYTGRGYTNPVLEPEVREGNKRGVSLWWRYLDQLFTEVISSEWPTVSREQYFELVRELWSQYQILPLFERGGPPHYPAKALTTHSFVGVLRSELAKRFEAPGYSPPPS